MELTVTATIGCWRQPAEFRYVDIGLGRKHQHAHARKPRIEIAGGLYHVRDTTYKSVDEGSGLSLLIFPADPTHAAVIPLW